MFAKSLESGRGDMSAAGLTALLRWGRARWEAVLFSALLVVLFPLFVVRAGMQGWGHPAVRALFVRWRRFLAHGLDDLRIACWPGIRFERAGDIWFHVVLIELFAVLNATSRPAQSEASSGILVIKLGHFGDTLHIFPMMRALWEQRAGERVDLLVGPWCAGLARVYETHDDVLVQAPRWGSLNRGGKLGRRSIGREILWLMKLRRRSYRIVVSSTAPILVEVLMMYALRAARWVGTTLPPHLYEPEGEAVLVPYDSRMHEADRLMGFLRFLDMNGGPADLYYPLSSEAIASAKRMLREGGIPAGGRYAVLCPGAGWPGKQWLPERFAEVGTRLCRQWGVSVVLVGSAGEQALCAEVARSMEGRVIQLAGKTTLDQLAAILSGASLFVGNDSGPMHVAACFSVPSVVFFGPSIASKWAPRHAAARYIQHEDCSGCIGWHYRATCLHENRCMKAIPVNEAWAAIQAVWKSKEQGRGDS